MNQPAALYPPNPANVPADLTELNWSYFTRALLVLASLILFFALYVGLVLGSAYMVYSSFKGLKSSISTGTPARNPNSRYAPAPPRPRSTAGQIVGQMPFIHGVVMIGSALLFLFLLKGFFKLRRGSGKSLEIEITEADQPDFFVFIRQLCKDTGAPMPHRVFLTPDVNAMVTYDSPLQSLFLPTPKNLWLGLGLVNQLNLTELKAVLAHEFGHFSQNSMKLGTYVFQANRLVADLVYGRDFFDDMIARMQRSDPRIAIFGVAFGGILWGLRKALEGLFKLMNFANSALSRQMEFNADLVAVTVTGSDPLVHALARIEIADQAQSHALRDLVAAGDHKLYTRDLFVHQARALDYLKQEKKDPHFGELPALPDDPTQTSTIFKPGDTGIPLMWATHPSNFDREQNAKRVYVRGVIDTRPAWVLFPRDSSVRERSTARYFEAVHYIPAKQLTDPARVQAFIDAEHAETTYPARFGGMYEDRYLDLAALEGWIHTPPEYRDRAYLSEQHAQLYGSRIKELMEHIQELRTEHAALRKHLETRNCKPINFRGKEHSAFDIPDLLRDVEREMDADRKRLDAEDRIIFQVHYAMAQQCSDMLALELLARYRFHAGVQPILEKTSRAFQEMRGVMDDLSGKRELSEEYFRKVIEFFQGMHVTLQACLDDANRLRLPRLENMVEGQFLGQFLLAEALVSYLASSTRTLNGKWLDRLAKQAAEIVDRSRRIYYKSLGGIFALQDKISSQWAAMPECTQAAECAAPQAVATPG